MELNQVPAETEQSIFEGVSDIERYQYEAGIRKARNALFVAGVIIFVTDMVMLLIGRDTFSDAQFYAVIATDVVILCLFIALGFWTKKKPFTALVIGLGIFCALQIFAIIVDPMNILKGVIVKVIVVVTLVSGIKNAKKLQDLNRLGL